MASSRTGVLCFGVFDHSFRVLQKRGHNSGLFQAWRTISFSHSDLAAYWENLAACWHTDRRPGPVPFCPRFDVSERDPCQ